MPLSWQNQGTSPRQAAPGGCTLWFMRLFILPHTIAGVCLAGNALLTAAWLLAGDNVTGHITQGWTSVSRKGTTSYHVEYTYKSFLTEHHEKGTVSRFIYDQLPGSIKGPGPLPKSASMRETFPITVRVFAFGPLRHAAPVPPVGASMASQFIGALFMAVFWNAILSVFVYLFWIQPIRMRRQLWRKVSRSIPGNMHLHS